jgi:hypothetical protein
MDSTKSTKRKSQELAESSSNLDIRNVSEIELEDCAFKKQEGSSKQPVHLSWINRDATLEFTRTPNEYLMDELKDIDNQMPSTFEMQQPDQQVFTNSTDTAQASLHRVDDVLQSHSIPFDTMEEHSNCTSIHLPACACCFNICDPTQESAAVVLAEVVFQNRLQLICRECRQICARCTIDFQQDLLLGPEIFSFFKCESCLEAEREEFELNRQLVE